MSITAAAVVFIVWAGLAYIAISAGVPYPLVVFGGTFLGLVMGGMIEQRSRRR